MPVYIPTMSAMSVYKLASTGNVRLWYGYFGLYVVMVSTGVQLILINICFVQIHVWCMQASAWWWHHARCM